MTSKEVTLTKEQQDNVVRWIVRGYDVKSIEFTNFGMNRSTGSYVLSIKINNDDNLGTVFMTYDYDMFDNQNGRINLDPVEEFQILLKKELLDDDAKVNLDNLNIIYLGE
ncbi:hypothetical protein MKL26_07370 [Streptococcus suis]|nr:hypothetical protein [Streptococcus suis]